MPDFAYIARDTSGQKVSGVVSAASQREALANLANQSLFPVEVKAAKSGSGFQIRLFSGVKSQTMAVTYSQLASLLRSGVPLLRSIRVIQKQSSNATLKEVLEDIHHQVEEGWTLGDAMARHRRVFSEMAINMVRAGGEGGFLEDALDRVAAFTEQQADLQSRTVGALAYPGFLATVGTVVVGFLLIVVVPSFDSMFDQLRRQDLMPIITETLLAVGLFLRQWLWLVAVGAVALIVVVRWRLQTQQGKRLRDFLKLKAPLLGVVFRNLAVARFCRVLGTMLKNGVPILKSLEVSRHAAGNEILSDAIAAATENITAGESLGGPLGASGHFPLAVVEMIAVAEESNTLDDVLVDIADGIERRTARQLDLLVKFIEPVMLLFLACMILLVVIALIYPIILMSQTI